MNEAVPTPTSPHRRRRGIALLAVPVLTLAACGSNNDGAATTTATRPPATTEPAATDPPTTEPPATSPPTTEPTDTPAPVTTSMPEPTTAPDALAEEIQSIIDASMQPGALDWACCGADGPPTGVSVAVRIPGRDDILLASGTNVDGTPFLPTGSFNLGTDSHAVLLALGYQLVDDGLLDPTATVAQWLPSMPNADRVTVQMLFDDTAGWDPGDTATADITADLSRRWTLAEVVDTLTDNPPLAEPGTFLPDSRTAGMIGLAAVIEAVGGQPLAELIEERFAAPAGLDDTFLSDGSDQPANYQHGVFVLDSQRMDTSMVDNVGFFTYSVADAAVLSTLADSLDMVEMWSDGSLFTTERVPGPTTFLASRRDPDPESSTVVGYGIPFNGYCPCEADGDGDGLSVTKFGRAGQTVGNDTQMLHFPDGISIVLHYNSQEWSTKDGLVAVSDAIHAAAAASI